ncbi:outer membrane beta-barrel protein [Caulobacter sp. 17J80-11]|uniref:outer membrane beta-barrel protein n=1 Tax=Caulobacter sp. 17J80-11 TaxID=2763502 RepID=UPI001653CD0A|nr:outer membrane beta-barrel protein [Caulobacter sp. 17J80-11]MBC6982303.1 hypothetical protein [Caulobacter sp. 17J80-11]
MRKSLCACVALSALALAAEAQAQAKPGEPMGFVDVGYTETDFDTDFANFNADTFSIGGSASIAGDGVYSDSTWGVQGDARVGWTEVGDDSSTGTEFGGHIFSRSQSALLGAFAGVSSTDLDFGDASGWAAGLEGLNFFGYTSVYGSVGYAQIDDLDSNGWGGSLEVRYFLKPNFRLDIGASAVDGDVLGDNGTVWSAGFGAEYQMDNLPISGFLSFAHSEFDNDIDDFSANTVSIGLRWNFSPDLLTRDRSGPALPSAARLVNMLSGV